MRQLGRTPGGRHAGLHARHVGATLSAMSQTTLDYFTPEDALAFRCSVAQVGTLKPADVSRETQPGNDVRPDVTEARLHVPRAFRALVRIMEGDNQRAALEAAREILTRAYGPPMQPALPAAPARTMPDAQPHPDWLDRQRLAYRAGEYDSPSGEYQPGQCLPRQ